MVSELGSKLKTDHLQIPEDLVEVGHIRGAYGVRGWIRVKPYSANAEALLTVRNWWIDKPVYRMVSMLQSRWQGDEVVAFLDGISDRNIAETLQGSVIRISRADFPPLDEGEFYWIDLIGLKAINKEGNHLGIVSGLIENGAHQILQIQANLPDGKKKELLIPFIDQFVGDVDQSNKTITVDWELDY